MPGVKRGNEAPGIAVMGFDYALLGPGGKGIAGAVGPGGKPALTFVLTFRPRVIVWLWLIDAPALTPLLTFRPRATVWLWLMAPWGTPRPPALTFVLTFIPAFSL